MHEPNELVLNVWSLLVLEGPAAAGRVITRQQQAAEGVPGIPPSAGRKMMRSRQENDEDQAAGVCWVQLRARRVVETHLNSTI